MANKPIVRVHFLDSSFRAFAIDPNANIETLFKTVIDKIDLKESNCFSIFEQYGDYERCLESEEKVNDIMKQWKENGKEKDAKFLFKKKIFLKNETKEAQEMQDPVAKNLLYIQAVYNVINSIYPCPSKDPEKTAILLGGLQLHIVYGEHNNKTHVPGFLPQHDLRNFVPKDLYSSKKPLEWESALFKEHARHKNRAKEEAQTKYLEKVKKWRFYGTTFYPPCKTTNSGRRLPSKVIIGVNAEGILLLKPKDKSEIARHPFTEICSWASSSNTFAFEFGTQSDATRYTFETKQGSVIAATIQTYIDILVDMLTNCPADEESSTATGTSISDQED